MTKELKIVPISELTTVKHKLAAEYINRMKRPRLQCQMLPYVPKRRRSRGGAIPQQAITPVTLKKKDVNSATLMMQAAGSFEMLGNFYQATRRWITECSTINV